MSELNIQKNVHIGTLHGNVIHQYDDVAMAEMRVKISAMYDLLRCNPDLHSAGIVANITATANDSLVKDGKTILSLQNIPAWNTNDVIVQAESEFRSIQDRYEALHEKWLSDRSDEATSHEFDEVASEYYEARKQFIKLKHDVFDDLCRAITLSLKENTSERLGLAYTHIIQGDYERANSFLALDDITAEIDNIYKRREAIEQAQSILETAEAHSHNDMLDRFKELLEGASVSSRLAKSKHDWDKVERYYSMALNIAIDFDLPKVELFKYVLYLQQQRKITQAIELIKKIHEHLAELTSQQKARFYQLAANLELKAGGKLCDIVFCFKNAFSYWAELTEEKISEEQQLQLVGLFLDVGQFWHRTFLNVKEGESVFADAYALLWETRKVINNVIKIYDGEVPTSHSVLSAVVHESITANRELLDSHNYEANLHRLMNSYEILAQESYDYAYLINEPVTTSDIITNKLAAHLKRSDILVEKGNIRIDFSNHNRKGDDNYLTEALFFFSIALVDLETVSEHEIQDDFDIECKIGRIQLNVSAVFRKLQFFEYQTYEMTNNIADIIALTGRTNVSELICVVDCEGEEKAHINKGLVIFENLYQLNPLKYRNYLYTAYIMRSEFFERLDLFDEAIYDCERVIDLYKRLPADVESNSGVYKSYIESELHLAHTYMRDKLNQPDKAVPHFENAIKTCATLAAKLPTEFEWKLVEVYTETAKAYGALGEFKKAKEIVFDKSHSILLKLLASDHRCNDGMWDKWLSIIELFFARMQQEFNEGTLDGKTWIDWVNTTWIHLIESYNMWLEELKKDVNILLPVVCRYVDDDGREDFVIKHFQEQFDTILFCIVCLQTAMFMCFNRKDDAVDLLVNALETYNVLSHRVAASAGILRQSIYFHEVRKNEYKKIEDILNSIDDGAFSDAVKEFRQLESTIVFEHANPIESDGMTWDNIADVYLEMISISDNNESFTKIYKDDISNCYGHLGYVLFMNGNSSEAEKYLALKINTLKEIETYDLPNEYAFMIEIVNSQISFGNFYVATDDYVKAIETLTEALNSQIEFVRKHGNNVIDATKTRAGFVGVMNPLINEEIVAVILRNMSYILEDYFNVEGANNAKNLFEENWETIKTIGSIIPQPAFPLIPFLFYEFIFSSKSDVDLMKSRYKELITLIEKYDAAVIKRKNDDNHGTIDVLFPLDTSKRSMAFYAYIKNFLMDKLSVYFFESDSQQKNEGEVENG